MRMHNNQSGPAHRSMSHTEDFRSTNSASSNNNNRRSSTDTDRLRPGPIYKHPVTFHYTIHHHTTRIQKLTNAFRVYRLMVLTLICVLAGLVFGLLCRPYAKRWTERQFMYIEFPGELYLRFLKLMIIPLLVSNVVLSFGTIQGKLSSRLGTIASSCYLLSNSIAIVIAILIVLLLKPGVRTAAGDAGSAESDIRMRGGVREPAEPAALHSSVVNSSNSALFADSHHLFNEYHESIKRYREYHPMYYHTVRNDSKPPAVGSSAAAQPRYIISSSSSSAAAGAHLHGQASRIRDPDHHHSDLPVTVGTVKYNNGVRNYSFFTEINQMALSTKLPIDVLLDILRNLVPDSVVSATMQQTRTRLFTPRELTMHPNGSTTPLPHEWPIGQESISHPNIVGLLALSVLAGVILSQMEEASKPILELCASVSELSLRTGMLAIHIAPICIMFLLIGQLARSQDLGSIAGELLMYSATVILALVVHGAVVLPIVYYLITKKSPLIFARSLAEALVAAFATSSSSASTALVLNCLSELDLNIVVIRAFGPLGAVFNMNGTAIYEAIAVIFIAQTLSVTLPFTSILLVGLSSAIASLSTSGIPSSGMMTMVIVLNSVNLPVLQLSLIYIVDFIIDRFRTVVNVWSGAIVCGLINHLCPEQLFGEEVKAEKYQSEVLMRHRGSIVSSCANSRKGSTTSDDKPQIISITITPPSDSSNL